MRIFKFFGIISGSEERGILFLQITVMFGMKKKRIRVKENTNVFQNSNILDICRDICW